MTVTRLSKMANINGNVYLKPCEGFKEELLTKSLECGTYLPWSRLNLEGGGCDVVTKRYDLYFGACDHIGTRWCLRCSFHVIMFVDPLGDALSFGDLCGVYKAGCCRVSSTSNSARS